LQTSGANAAASSLSLASLKTDEGLRVEVFSSRTAAALPLWYAPLLSAGPSGLVNAALLRAVWTRGCCCQ
jgi:hypothetical protein